LACLKRKKFVSKESLSLPPSRLFFSFFPSRQETHTINPLTIRTSQKSDHSGNIGGNGTAAERAHAGDALFDLVQAGAGVGAGGVVPRVGAEHVGLDPAGRDGVDGDALGARVGGEGAREAFDCCFGAGVQRVVGDAGHVGCDGGHEDDAAAA
jgi:hypothetical protein